MLAGLTEGDATCLVRLIVACRKLWRLPFGAADTPTRSQKSLPQGLSASVLLAELFLSLLLHRMQDIPGLETIGYIDDISILTGSELELRAAYRLVKEFEADFEVKVATGKCALWGSSVEGLQNLSDEWGFPVVSTLSVLGCDWPFSSIRPTYEKENSRLSKAKSRLERLACVAASFTTKFQAVRGGLSVSNGLLGPAYCRFLEDPCSSR